MLRPTQLGGQHGYAMAALLVALSVMAILMTAAMPVWRHAAQREKETELIFRGQQYARAIGLFQRKAGPGVLPPNLDVLIEQHFLRKKYQDPITGQDFDLLSPVQQTAGSARPGTAFGVSGRQGGPAPSPPASAAQVGASQRAGQAAPQGGILGVASKSKESSIRLYNGRSHYNEWQFIYVQRQQAPGAPGGPGGRGLPQRGGEPGRVGIPGIGGRDGRGGRGGFQETPPFRGGPGSGFPQPSQPARPPRD